MCRAVDGHDLTLERRVVALATMYSIDMSSIHSRIIRARLFLLVQLCNSECAREQESTSSGGVFLLVLVFAFLSLADLCVPFLGP